MQSSRNQEGSAPPWAVDFAYILYILTWSMLGESTGTFTVLYFYNFVVSNESGSVYFLNVKKVQEK